MPTRRIDQRIARAVIEEATERAERSGEHNCLIWPDKTDSNGYGVSAHYGGFRAHRLAYAAVHGDPGDMLVRHKVCGNPPCFDHEHLDVGTDADNAADRVRMGRSNPQRALTPEQEREVVDLVEGGMRQSEVAALYGVGQGTISRACKGKLSLATGRRGRFSTALTDAQVLAARRDYSAGANTIREIADRHGLSWPATQAMLQGRTFQHLGFAHVGPPVTIEREAKLCGVPGCDRKMLARDMCTGHYNRWKNTGDVRADVPLREARGGGHAPKALTDEDVRSIRRRFAAGEKVAHIARDLGVAHGTVKAVVDRRTWAHVTDDGVGS